MSIDNSGKDDIKSTAADLYEREKEIVSDAYDAIKDKAEALTEKVSETACDLYNQGKLRYNDLEQSVCEYSDEVIKAIKEKPLSSVLIAAGVGFLISKLLK
ncbi:MAG: DUF883 domain-containing protein [Legionella sp.]|nr:DUF883 domain-containing protein [Legionella sp.]